MILLSLSLSINLSVHPPVASVAFQFRSLEAAGLRQMRGRPILPKVSLTAGLFPSEADEEVAADRRRNPTVADAKRLGL